MSQLFVGLDLHKSYSEYAVMDPSGKLLRQGRIENTLDRMREFSESIPRSSSMVIESSSTWYWAHKLLSERHNVTLSNPIKNKAIASAKVKTDKIDSITLANLLRGGWAAECYVPSKETMEFRGARQVQGQPGQGEDQVEESHTRIPTHEQRLDRHGPVHERIRGEG